MSLEAFMASAASNPKPRSGNTPWAEAYATTLKNVLRDDAARRPRNVQRDLGPSELGTDCDRQVVGKLAGEPVTNHVTDPWPAIVGTALHTYAEEAFTRENYRLPAPRWITESRVWAWDDVYGTADLLDGQELVLVDHKFLGETSQGKVIRHGAPTSYRKQLWLYGNGYRRKGINIKRLALAAWNRTSPTIDSLYVWEELWSPEVEKGLEDLRKTTEFRRYLASMVLAGSIDIDEVATAPNDHDCYFCPFYRPQKARDNTVAGCAGTATNNEE